MKGMKGKFMKKLKSIKQVGYLKQDRILQLKASDGYVDFLPKIPTFNLHSPFVSRENKPEKVVQEKEPEIIDVAELMKDLEDEEDDDEMDLDDYNHNKENIGPCSQKPPQHHKGISENGNRGKTESKQRGVLGEKRSSPRGSTNSNSNGNRKTLLLDNDIPVFRRPDLNSGSLFDPNLLAAFEQAVKDHARMEEEQSRARVETDSQQKVEDDDPDIDPLMSFEEKCPPGGDSTVIFYTTTLRGIRKTFEDCNKIRFLLQSFKVLYFERDISMHKEFRNELWSSLEGKLVPPRLFVKGRYIGGAEEVLSLHEQGKLRKIFEGLPMDYSSAPCDACGGIRFVLCFKCNGSQRVMEENGDSNVCPQCNENGLIVCPYCC